MLSSVQAALQPIPPPMVDVPQTSRPPSDPIAESGDSYEKSAFSTMFEQLGLNPNSRLEATHDRVDFNFSFTSSTKQTLSASGYVAQQEQHASMTLNYTFQRAVVVDGKREVKTFQASIAFDADTSQSSSVKPFKQKEDIMHFLNRLLNDVMTLMQDESQVLSGISLNQDDLAEIMNMDNEKVKSLFNSLIASIMTMAMLKRLKRGTDAGPNVFLKEQRQSTEGITAENKSSAQCTFSITIKAMAEEQSIQTKLPDASAAPKQALTGNAA
jgi:hypothetical protein